MTVPDVNLACVAKREFRLASSISGVTVRSWLPYLDRLNWTLWRGFITILFFLLTRLVVYFYLDERVHFQSKWPAKTTHTHKQALKTKQNKTIHTKIQKDAGWNVIATMHASSILVWIGIVEDLIHASSKWVSVWIGGPRSIEEGGGNSSAARYLMGLVLYIKCKENACALIWEICFSLSFDRYYFLHNFLVFVCVVVELMNLSFLISRRGWSFSFSLPHAWFPPTLASWWWLWWWWCAQIPLFSDHINTIPYK